MRSIFIVLGLSLFACTQSASELLGARCDSTRSDPCGSTLVCHPETQRCVAQLDVDAGADASVDAGVDAGFDGGARCTVQGFTTLDEFKPEDCQSALAMSVAIHPTTDPWVVVQIGANGCDGGPRMIQRTFHDGGWLTAVDVWPANAQPLLGRLAVTPDASVIFAGGEQHSYPDGGWMRQWRVWRRALGSTLAQELFDPSSTTPSGTDDFSGGVAVDAKGQVFAVGGRSNALVVRRHAQNAWADVLVDARPGNSLTPTGGIAVDTAGRLYVAGEKQGTDGGVQDSQWFTTLGTDDGTRWDAGAVDSPAGNNGVRGIAASPNGTVYVLGYEVQSQQWLVRRGINSGTAWAETDRWQYAQGQQAIPYGAAATDEVAFVVGGAYDDAGYSVWVVRKFEEGAWTTADAYAPTTAQSVAVAAAIDPKGDVYVVGMGSDDAGVGRAVVRRALCQ